jgi:lysophospholipase L1-like esterase
MGDLTNLTDTTKFKPAFYKLVYGLMAHFPNTKLLVITPIHRDDNHPDATPNGQGLTLKDYRDAEIEICERLGIPYLDMYTKLGFSPLSYNIKSLYMPDGIHPNSDGMRRLGDTIIHAITEL